MRLGVLLALTWPAWARCLESRLRADLVPDDEIWLVVAESGATASLLLEQLQQCVPFHSADGQAYEREKVRCVVAAFNLTDASAPTRNSSCAASLGEPGTVGAAPPLGLACAPSAFAVFNLGAAPAQAELGGAVEPAAAALGSVRDLIKPNLVLATVSAAGLGPVLKRAILAAFSYAQNGGARERAPIIWPLEQLGALTWVRMLPAIALTRWHVPHLTVVAITWRRPESLARLLASLGRALYFGDDVSLRFEVDGGHDAATAAIARREVASWPYGRASHRLREHNVGLATAVLESYDPRDDTHSEYAVLLEDDIEVSRAFYGWLKYALLTFRHGRQTARDPRLLGVSLYTPRLEELTRPRRRLSHYGTLRGRAFAQQLPCSWGALYFPEHWRRFRAYQSVRSSDSFDSSQLLKRRPSFSDPAVRWRYWIKLQQRFARLAHAAPAAQRNASASAPGGKVDADNDGGSRTRTPPDRPAAPRRLGAEPAPAERTLADRPPSLFRPKLNVLSERIIIPKTVVHTWRASWKKFMIEMMFLRGEFMLYPNFPGERSFSTNHLEKGVHIGAEAAGKRSSAAVVEHRKEDYTVPLHDDVFADASKGWVPLPERASMLPHLNLTANVTTTQLVDSRAASLLNLPKHRALQGFMHHADQSERNTFTVILNTFMRDACLWKCVLAWLACPAAAQIRIVWSEVAREPPLWLRKMEAANPKRLVVDEYTLNRLSNRLRPAPQAPTIGVFIADDDLYFGCVVLREAHERWLNAERKGVRPMVGFAPRFLRRDGKYDPHTAYDREMQRNVIFPTKGAFIHRDDLELFWHARFARAVEAVDRHTTAEDITFALAHSVARALPPIVLALHRKQVTELCCTRDAAGVSRSRLYDDVRTCAIAKNFSLHSRTREYRPQIFRFAIQAAGGQQALDRVTNTEHELVQSTIALLKADLATIMPYETNLGRGRAAVKPMRWCLQLLARPKPHDAEPPAAADVHGRQLVLHHAHLSDNASPMARCLVRWYHPPYLLLVRI